MFNFRDFRSEELAAWEKQEIADELLDHLKKEFKLQHSELLEKLFVQAEVDSFECLKDIAKFFKAENQRLGLVIMQYNRYKDGAPEDIQEQLDLLQMSRESSTIPYFAWSFPNDYKTPYGADYNHVYFFFITKYKEFKIAEECIAYYVDKYDQLGSFA